MRSFLLLAILSTVVCVSMSASAATWYVDASVSSSGDGTSWETAFKTIREGIDAASDGDTVVVAKGIYGRVFLGKDILLCSTDPLDDDVVAATVLEVSGRGPVVTFTGKVSEACVLSGFTIRGGRGNYGGGICGGWGYLSRATIQNNVIMGNSADNGGGLWGCDGIIQDNTIENNTVSANSVTWHGGGLSDCGGTIRRNRIIGNSARGRYGGGLCYCHGTIQNNVIAGNSAENGAGLYDCDGTIEGNTIASNSAADNGGGLHRCDGTIGNNTITCNSAGYEGGGLYGCGGTIRSNTITGNSAHGSGGALAQCNASLQNNTIVANAARVPGAVWPTATTTTGNNTRTRNSHSSGGGGIYECGGVIVNCIFWGNTAPAAPQILRSTQPTYCCVQGWMEGGEGNVSDDPRFVDPGGPDDNPGTYGDNDYRLSAGSPCIDTGTNEDWMWGAVDFDGKNRIMKGLSSPTVDMGAYEYGSFHFKITGVIRAEGNQLTWTSRPDDTYAVWSREDLCAAEWMELATVPSQGSITSWIHDSPLGRVKFYRVEMK